MESGARHRATDLRLLASAAKGSFSGAAVGAVRPLLLLGTAIPVLALAVALSISLPKKLIYNGSQSAPIGLYWIDQEPVMRGDYALVRVPERVRKLVEDRRYLPSKVPLLKRVVGLSGDRFCRQDEQVLMNDKAIATALKRYGQG